VPLPNSAGATHTATERLHIIILVVEEVIVVVVVVPHHLDISVQVVPEVSIDTFCLPALAHFFTGENSRNLPPWLFSLPFSATVNCFSTNYQEFAMLSDISKIFNILSFCHFWSFGEN